MVLTIRDALQLDVFKGAGVVAGSEGLHRPIDWVHNVGVPDAARWLNGGELVLTTSINMPPTQPEQEAYLLAMIDKHVAGLAIAVGRYIDSIPPYLCKIADEHHFPLIEVPYQARFVDIARTINQTIAQRDVKQALTIHQTLTKLILDGGDITALAETLANLVQQSVSIENDRFEAFASHNIAEIDEARRYTQTHGHTDPRLVRALDERNILPQIRRTLRPVQIPQMPDVGLEMERILAPIVVHGEIFGYVWIIGDGRPLSELERMAIESGATIAALMLLRQEAVQREEASQQGDLLSSLMQTDAATREELLTDRALRYGIDLRKPYRVLLAAGNPNRAMRNRMIRLLEKQGWMAIAGMFAGQILLLAQDEHHLKAIAAQMQAMFNGDGVGSVSISGLHHGVAQVALAYRECRETLAIMQRIKPDARTVSFDELGYLHLLYRSGHSALEHNPYVATLRPLAEAPQADLFHTLDVYLDVGGNGVATAEALHIHRSTLNYRLARITEICQVDLANPTVRTNLQIALKLMRLFD